MLDYRLYESKDFEKVSRLVSSRQELLFAFPRGNYPLTEERFERETRERFQKTVIILNSEVVGFVSLYNRSGNDCFIGNVMVDHSRRKQGVGRFLLSTIETVAANEYDIKKIYLHCWGLNNTGLLFYHTSGYKPVEMVKRTIADQEVAVFLLEKNII